MHNQCRAEIARLVLSGQHQTFNELPSQWNDFSFSLLSKRFVSHLGLTKFDDNALRTLGLVSADGSYTIAAEILSDRNGLPGVDIVRFGSSINELLDRKTVVGKSALLQYDAAMEMYERYGTYEKIQGAVRKRIERIPREAFREAIANALVHRTWDVAANVTVAIYDDRVVITSPGGLPEGISEREYLEGGISVPRNPILANVFFRLDYIEQFGTGVARINDAYEDMAVKPHFEVRQNSLVVTLPAAAKTASGLTSDEATVLQALSRTLLLSRGDIEQRTGFSRDKTVRMLNNLALRGFVVKEGNGRNRKYRRV